MKCFHIDDDVKTLGTADRPVTERTMPDMQISQPARQRRHKNQPIFLMISLFLLLLVYPAVEGKPFAQVVLNSLFSLLLLSAALGIWRNRWLLLTACCIGLPWIVISWLDSFVDMGIGFELFRTVLMIVFIFFVITVLVVNVMTTTFVTANTLCRAVSTYLLIGIAWAAIYSLVGLLDPGAFYSETRYDVWSEYAYFSFTLGFGDISPVSPYARSLAMVEAVIGPMYVAILVARLVALYRKPK